MLPIFKRDRPESKIIPLPHVHTTVVTSFTLFLAGHSPLPLTLRAGKYISRGYNISQK